MSRRRSSRAWLLGVAVLAGCSSAPGGVRHYRYAEAAEVPADVTQRDQLAGLIAAFAQRNGLYYADTTPRVIRTTNGRQTLAIALQRKLTNGRPWNEISVTALGDDAALITFVAPLDGGVVPESNSQRAMLMAELRAKWPGTADLPILPDGGIPRFGDVRRTAQGLKIDPAKAAPYHLPADSPLIAK